MFKYATYYCPVGDDNLGTFDKGKIVIAHCDDCKVKYVWKPGETKPMAIFDSDKKPTCGCDSCRALGR